MPVTPTLLSRLRETLGEEATNDLVTWVEHSSDHDMTRLRELAELYYQRFDAKLEQRLAETKGELRTELRSELAALRVEMASQRSDLIKWMFIFWAGTVIPLAGLMVALFRL